MRDRLKEETGLITAALAYVVLATTVVSMMLSWFLLGQAQSYVAIQQDKNAAAVQESAARFLYAINTAYDSTWLTDSKNQLQTATAPLGNESAVGSTAVVTSLTSPNARTLVATITATSVQNASITLTKQITYRSAGAYAFGSFDPSNASRPTWAVLPSATTLGLYEMTNSTQVNH